MHRLPLLRLITATERSAVVWPDAIFCGSLGRLVSHLSFGEYDIWVDLQVQRCEERAFVSGRLTFLKFADDNWHFAGRRQDEGVPAVPLAKRAEQQ